ncbi:hypothetical protein DOY81_008836 [Sarcophaga bullata]|nr:hypothetical protein DOY81_008836 [Sarcophaga bullata]
MLIYEYFKVPPHHIKTYQIEKYEETNLESVMSAIHFMVTTQHFIKGQMRLKCTASIFDIFQEEIESIIEEDRPRIMASGQSHPPDHGYDSHGDSEGYEHNESYLTYFSAPKSSASRSTEFILTNLLNRLKQKTFALLDTKSYVLQCQLTTTLVNNIRYYCHQINQYGISSTCSQLKQPVLRKYITSVMVIFLMAGMLRKIVGKKFQMIITFTLTAEEPVTLNCIESIMEVIRQTIYNFQVISLWHKKQYRLKKEPQRESVISYQNANNDDCQAKCDQLLQQQDKHCIVVANQNVFNGSFFSKDTNITTIEKNKNETIAARTLTAIDYHQHQMTQRLAVARLLSPYKCIHTMPPPFTSSLPDSSSLSSFPSWLSLSSAASASSLLPSLLSSTTLADRKTYAHDSFPLYTLGASKSNNAKYMSKDQTLLMTFTLTAAMTSTTLLLASLSTCATLSALALLISPKHCTYKTSLSSSPLTSSASVVVALVLESKLLETSVVSSLEISKFSPLSLSFRLTLFFAGNNYLMAFIGELLLHQC